MVRVAPVVTDFWNTEKKSGKYAELFKLHTVAMEAEYYESFQSQFHDICK